jgi:hypothetical protein
MNDKSARDKEQVRTLRFTRRWWLGAVLLFVLSAGIGYSQVGGSFDPVVEHVRRGRGHVEHGRELRPGWVGRPARRWEAHGWLLHVGRWLLGRGLRRAYSYPYGYRYPQHYTHCYPQRDSLDYRYAHPYLNLLIDHYRHPDTHPYHRADDHPNSHAYGHSHHHPYPYLYHDTHRHASIYKHQHGDNYADRDSHPHLHPRPQLYRHPHHR